MTKLSLIPAGEFTMGAADGPHPEDGEGPVRTIYLDDYAISKTAVSKSEFSAFASATGCISTAERIGGSHVFQGQLHDPDNHRVIAAIAPWWRWVKGANWRRPNGQDKARPDDPVVNVSYFDALAYCHWSETRPPTEAEWERAAGTQDGISPHIWQGQFPDHPLISPEPKPVLDGIGNEFGLIHACGNTWEWTADRFSRLYSPRSDKNPKGPLNGTSFVGVIVKSGVQAIIMRRLDLCLMV